MERAVCGATIVAATLVGGTALAQSADVVDHAEAAEAYGPSDLEAGLFFGGFVSNYYHQFFDDNLFPSIHTNGANDRPRLKSVNPEFGVRFAMFPRLHFGVEGELSSVLAHTETMGDSVQIYGLGLQGIVQWPGRITPYLGLGVSLRYTSSADDVVGTDADVPVHASAGARFWLTQAVAVRAELRYIRGPSQGYGMDPAYTLNASYGEFTIGLSFNPRAPVERHSTRVELDPDHDGVLATADKCPFEPGEGNPDGCPTRDSDGDGFQDNYDHCPKEKETFNRFQDDDGCPDDVPDVDNDGIEGNQDRCPTVAEDRDGYQDDDGCPDADNDSDGVLDEKDKCPDKAGPIENGGCPDTDRDGDNVVDRLDNCPDEKGTEKNHGCKAPQLVVLTKDRLMILDQVKFPSASARIPPISHKLLDNVARVLLAHPEITKVKVEGHTDNVGKPDFNLTLSQKRAQSIVDYLIRKGVGSDRLEAIGHGDTQPLEDNKTAKGRQQNRRVEFNIVGQ